PILLWSCVPLTSVTSSDLSSAFSMRAQMNATALATLLAYGPSLGVLPARTSAKSATQVLPTSGGSLTCAPSIRPPWSPTRQPPPWPQPPSAPCCLTRYASPFLTASLSGLGVGATPACAGVSDLPADFAGSAAGGSARPTLQKLTQPTAAARTTTEQS